MSKHPTLENLNESRDELIEELEEGILPIIEKCCYRNPSVTRNEEDSQVPSLLLRES